ncbi:hypothetical protein MMC11_005767 [Xylographa trunciseda]|nr:hypothetical protein [Xylographa trunciseda]
MDPISSVASILTVVGAAQDGAKISLKFLKTLKKAPLGLQALLDEVAQIEAVLSDVKNACEYGQRSTAALDLLLTKAATKLLQLNELIHFKLVKPREALEVDRQSFARYQGEVAELKDDLKSLRQDITAVLAAANLVQANQVRLELSQVLQYAVQGLFQRIEESQDTQRALTSLLGEFRRERAVHTAAHTTIPVVTSDAVTCQINEFTEEPGFPATAAQSDSMIGTGTVTTAASNLESPRSVCRGIQDRSPRRASEINYALPLWIANRMLSVWYKSAPFTGPELLLKTRRMIVTSSYVHAERGLLEPLRQMYIDGQASIHDVDPIYGKNALATAVLYQRLSVTQFLLNAGADVNCENFEGWSPADYMQEMVLRQYSSNPCEMSTWLSLFGLDLEGMFQDLPCLHRVVLGFSSRELEDELREHPESIDGTDWCGRTALWWSTLTSLNPSSGLLLEHGADPHISDRRGMTPLDNSAESGDSQILTLLYDKGAKIKPNVYGQWPIHRASIFDRSHETLKLLLKWGCDPNVQDGDRQTPLHWTTQYDSYRNARILLHSGANASLIDENGHQPWVQAISHNSPETLRVLLDHGSDISSCDTQGYTVLHRVAEHALQPIVDVLEEADLTGVNADAKDKYGYTADDRLWSYQANGHRRRPGCSLELHESIARLIDKVRAANHDVHEISDAEESTSDHEGEVATDDDDESLGCESSEDECSSYEDARDAWEAERSS